MFTRDERRALLFLATVAAAGGLIRVTRSAASGPAPAAVAPQLAGEDVVRQAALSRTAQALARPLEPGERVDVDRAPAEELQRLPRIGRRLALRIAADRLAHGPFGSLEALRRVPGVGASLLRGLEPWVTFSAGPPAPAVTYPGAAFVSGAHSAVAPEKHATASGAAAACAGPVAPNRATAEQLMCLPGIGAVLAERIVADRAAHGAFRDIADLARIPGIGRSRIERLKGRVTFP